MVRRSRLIVCFIALIFIGILINLFTIAYNNPAQPAASSQSKWTATVSETRGTIYDRNLQPLVNAVLEYKAACSPDVNLLPLLEENTTDKTYQYITKSMLNGVPIVAPLRRAIPQQDNLLCFLTKKRYGEHVLASHIIGYCQDGVGVSGVEMACDALLNSYSGRLTVTYETDGSKQYLNGIQPLIKNTTDRSAGGVVLTLDREIQTIVESTVRGILSKGAVVVLEPYSGDVVACASLPAFQPDDISQSLIDDNGALLNRALSLYDCGSVFKIITTAAALENGISPSTMYICDGLIDVGGTVFHCHNRSGHGTLDMTQAFSLSCNTYFIQLAQEIGADALYSLANAFGFDRKITLASGLSSANPLLPTRQNLEQPAALANLSFGQGYLMTTPLHIAQIVATIVNDGKMPSVNLLQGYIDENKNVSAAGKQSAYTVISQENAVILQQMLSAVVESGTGKSAKPPLCTAAGKTGTAETGQLSGDTAVVQSWFAGYYPAEDPQYVIVVLAEDTNTTNEHASHVFCEISNNLYKYSIAGDSQ